MILESILSKHEKKFIDLKLPKKAMHGTLYDGDGVAFVSDAIQALKVSGLTPVGFPWIRGLNGKAIEEDTSHLNMLERLFSRELEHVASINIKELSDAAKLLHSVQKEDLKGRKKEHRDLMAIKLVAKEGVLSIRYDTPKACEFVSGSVEVGSSSRDCEITVNCKRLIDCLNVFVKDFESVDILIVDSLVRFEAVNVSTILLTIAKGGHES